MMALPKQYRLTHKRDFSRVYQQGSKSTGRHLVVRILKFPEEQAQSACSRFGISISQKVSKRAVVRNRLKRQVRAALQKLIPRLRSGLWVVVILRRTAVQCDYWQFLQELEEIFLELEVCNGN